LHRFPIPFAFNLLSNARATKPKALVPELKAI
jgi:hypothetical protein